MKNKTSKGTFLYTYNDYVFNNCGCSIKVEQEDVVDNSSKTHIELKEEEPWQDLIIKHTKNKFGEFKIEIDVTGNWEAATLAKAFIKIGENIIKNNPSYIADE